MSLWSGQAHDHARPSPHIFRFLALLVGLVQQGPASGGSVHIFVCQRSRCGRAKWTWRLSLVPLWLKPPRKVVSVRDTKCDWILTCSCLMDLMGVLQMQRLRAIQSNNPVPVMY